jgi:hypothetical protein
VLQDFALDMVVSTLAVMRAAKSLYESEEFATDIPRPKSIKLIKINQ